MDGRNCKQWQKEKMSYCFSGRSSHLNFRHVSRVSWGTYLFSGWEINFSLLLLLHFSHTRKGLGGQGARSPKLRPHPQKKTRKSTKVSWGQTEFLGTPVTSSVWKRSKWIAGPRVWSG
jgi:hypothetical protein